MKKLLLSLVTVVLVSCSASAPNNVTLTFTPSQCVTGSYPGYESSSFPSNSNLPESSPLCIAATMTNNNSGENSNNVQVYQQGLQLTYTYNGTQVSSTIMDYNASGGVQPSIPQQFGNIAVFDPNNCVTMYGRYVKTLMKGGGTCTFYLQSVGDTAPIGKYPVNVSVNYTNGNSNYIVESTIYNNVNMYIGGNFTSPSQYIAKYESGTNAESIAGLNYAGESVQLVAKDVIGNVYFYDGTSVYLYNGTTLNNITGSLTGVNSLRGDLFGNMIAATNGGLYVYSAYTNTPSWTPLTNTLANAVSSINQSGSNLLVFTGESGVESCILANNACTPAVLFSGSGYNNSALAATSINQIVWGSGNNLFNESATPLSVLIGATFAQNGTIGLDGYNYIYSASNAGSLSPAVFSNIANSTTLAPLQDSSNNPLIGNANGVLLRAFNFNSIGSFMNVFVYGGNFDLVGSPLVYLPMIASGNNYIANNTWSAIGGFDLGKKVNSVAVSSYLTLN